MCKSKAFVLLLVFISTVQGDAIDSIIENLERVYEYILTHHDLMNIDSIFGVVLSQAFLAEVYKDALTDQKAFRNLTTKGGLIISKSIEGLENSSTFHKKFVEVAFDPINWQRGIEFKSGLLDENYLDEEGGIEIQANDYISAVNRRSFNESFSDNCIMEILQGPDPSTNACKISPLCGEVMVDDPDFGKGYTTTHRLLYSQLSRISGCKFDESKIKKYCSKILLETRSIHNLNITVSMQDLLFEQVTLCGMEGFEEFMEDATFIAAIQLQQEKGCYGFVPEESKVKREANVIDKSCIDHTTGLGASILSLYLKFFSELHMK